MDHYTVDLFSISGLFPWTFCPWTLFPKFFFLIPELKHRQSQDSGLRKWAGIPGLESLHTLPTDSVCVKDFFKESLTPGPLRLCVNEKTVRVNDSPYFQFKGHTYVPHPIPIKIIKIIGGGAKIKIVIPHWVTKWVIRWGLPFITYALRAALVAVAGRDGQGWRKRRFLKIFF